MVVEAGSIVVVVVGPSVVVVVVAPKQESLKLTE